MEASEEIVTAWLNQEGFFTLNNYKVGGNELDLLAFNPLENKKWHIEMSVSVLPIGGWARHGDPLKEVTFEALGPQKYEERIEKRFRSKFIGENGRIESKVREIFGGDYERYLVVGKLSPAYDPRDSFIQAWKKHGVEVKFFRDIIRQIKITTVSYRDLGRRYIQLIETFRYGPE